MAWEFNTELIIKILEEADFDAYESGNINAVKEIDGINHQFYINPQGRIRYQYSRLLKNDYKNIEISGSKFSWDKDNRDIVNIIGQLGSIEQLISFIKEVNKIIGEGR